MPCRPAGPAWIGALLAVGIAPAGAWADDPPPPGASTTARAGVPTPVTGLGQNLADLVTDWTNVAMFAAAGAGTAILIGSGADHEVHILFHDHPAPAAWGQAAYYTGYALPVLFPIGMYATAALADRHDLWGAAAATTQALALTLAVTGALKLGTGRSFPTHGEAPSDPHRFHHEEYSSEFAPFSGAWAWPSGHTSASITIAATLTAYYPEHLWIPLVTYPLTAAIAGGMLAGEHHWASDVLGGALIGQVIGYTIGRAFRERAAPTAAGRRARPKDGTSVQSVFLVPTATGNYNGITLGAAF